jgi:hypothetical protein
MFDPRHITIPGVRPIARIFRKSLPLLRKLLLNKLRRCEIQTAARVAKLVFDSGLPRVERPTDMVAFIRKHVYTRNYKAEVNKAKLAA